ncbi:MAG TPA: aldo/keto reductase [Acidimicrobiales bacterium]
MARTRRVVERRTLGTTGIEVSRLALGAMTFGAGMPPIAHVDTRTAHSMVERAVAAGINLVDTADAYGDGESEQILAPVLARHRDLLVSTKVGWGGGHERPLARESVIADVEASLRRLGRERIDILSLHRPDRRTPIEETFDALQELVERDLVRTVGVSNWTAGETAYAVGRQRGLGQAEPTSVQVYWSLVGREVEHEIVPLCQRLDLGVVVWSPLAGGYLADRRDGRHAETAFPPINRIAGARVLASLRFVAKESGSTPAAVALAWLLRRPEVTTVLVGASTMKQLDANLAASRLELEDDLAADLDDVSAILPIYPRWWDQAMGLA